MLTVSLKDFLHLYPERYCVYTAAEPIDRSKCWIKAETLLSSGLPLTGYKLLLRSLYDLSEADEMILTKHQLELLMYLSNEDIRLTQTQFMYLLRKGYDLFQLFEQGLALDERKMNREKF